RGRKRLCRRKSDHEQRRDDGQHCSTWSHGTPPCGRCCPEVRSGLLHPRFTLANIARTVCSADSPLRDNSSIPLVVVTTERRCCGDQSRSVVLSPGWKSCWARTMGCLQRAPRRETLGDRQF